MTLSQLNGSDPARKRLLQVTAANLRHSHLYVRGHYDFSPKIASAARNDSPLVRPLRYSLMA